MGRVGVGALTVKVDPDLVMVPALVVVPSPQAMEAEKSAGDPR